MRIDFHTHAFPDSLAPRAMSVLEKNNSEEMAITPHTDGTAGGSMELLKSVGIDRAVVCNIATNVRQESNVNSFAIELADKSDFFYPLGSVHPDSEQKASELDRLMAAGIRGVKLHPDYVRIPLSDKRFDEIFSLLEERNMFAVVHAGFDPVSPECIHNTPEMMKEVIRKHKDLKLVAAHMGGLKLANEVLTHLVGKNIYLDTSLCSLRAEESELLVKILREHDENKLLFGTDTPWSEPAAEISFIENAPISSTAKKKIFFENAAALLGI